ncbi:hypothetical protein I0C86_23300 [Plantactinospora sp. S1510]|uniref:Uncharacterized protein n=1 Tax=Plantactinospora alkalitolerans TaxID=2789879 RepID=A0ABS0H075_9ACTN|nr:hypothetical protein [Plantactinospora alkalitolerans]MBF9131868.1 hypothetical protein [Plantactinospora alkalitolerans]
MRRISAELLAQRTDLRIAWDLSPTMLGPGRAYRMVEGRVEALDPQLRSTGTAAAPPGKLLNASPELDVVVVSDGDDLVVRRSGVDVRLAVPGADSATLLDDGWLLVTAPVFEKRSSEGHTYTSKDAHRVLLIDPEGTIIHEATLNVTDAGVTALPHPQDGSVILTAGEGQDGGAIFRVRVDGAELRVQRILENAVAADFNPSGSRLLVTPHPSFDDAVRVLSWPDLTPLHELSEDVLAEDEVFDVYGCFLSESRVILSVAENMPLICTAELVPEGRIALPPSFAEAETVTLVGLAENVFGLDLYLEENLEVATVWHLPSAAHAGNR